MVMADAHCDTPDHPAYHHKHGGAEAQNRCFHGILPSFFVSTKYPNHWYGKSPDRKLEVWQRRLILPQVLANPEFAPAVGFARSCGGSHGNWRGALDIA